MKQSIGKTKDEDIHPPVPSLPKKSRLSKKAEEYLRESGKIEDLPDEKMKGKNFRSTVKKGK